MSWATERRLDWIDDRLTEGLTLQRRDIERYFGVQTCQASIDINEFIKLDPNLVYDKSARCYRRNGDGAGSVRHSTAFRRQAWAAWPIGQAWCPDADEHKPGVVCYECKR